MMITVGSLFAGIGGFDLAAERSGMRVAWQCEADKHARAVLNHHWPETICDADIRTAAPVPGSADLICGGWPCQDLSVAGRRAGLAGERSGLFHDLCRVVADVRPRWLLLENVPGLLSANGGRDGWAVVRALTGIGYGIAWRVLDAQYAGVAQRRRRVFIVGCYGGRCDRAAAVLLEPGCLCGNPPTRGAARPNVAGTLGRGAGERGGDAAGAGQYVADTLTAHDGPGGYCNGGNNPKPRNVVVASFSLRGRDGEPQAEADESGCVSTLRASRGGSDKAFVGGPSVGVRRLTPRECERLQGFPDDWTRYARRESGETYEQSDTQRYRQVGNAVAVPVVEWIMRRIAANDSSAQRSAEGGEA